MKTENIFDLNTNPEGNKSSCFDWKHEIDPSLLITINTGSELIDFKNKLLLQIDYNTKNNFENDGLFFNIKITIKYYLIKMKMLSLKLTI